MPTSSTHQMTISWIVKLLWFTTFYPCPQKKLIKVMKILQCQKFPCKLQWSPKTWWASRKHKASLFSEEIHFSLPLFYLVHVNKCPSGNKRSNGARCLSSRRCPFPLENTCIVWKYFNIFMCIPIVSRRRSAEGAGTRYAAIIMPPVLSDAHKHVNGGNIQDGCSGFIVL